MAFIVQLQNYQSEAHYAAKLKRSGHEFTTIRMRSVLPNLVVIIELCQQTDEVVNDFPSQLENDNIKQQDAAVIRNALWASDRLLQDFIESNPNNLSDADLELAASWKNRVAAKFFIMRHLQKLVFSLMTLIIQLLRCHRHSLANRRNTYFTLPTMVDAVLLPFGDKIILTAYSILSS